MLRRKVAAECIAALAK